MELKQYQKDVVSSVKKFASMLDSKTPIQDTFHSYWEGQGVDVSKLFTDSLHSYKDTVPGVPRVTVKVPTAGGKTFIACNALSPLAQICQKDRPAVIAWFVPSDAILRQTYRNLSNPDHPYRQRLNTIFGNNVVVLDKETALQGQSLTPTKILEQTTIFVLSVSSFASADKEGRRSYRENENLAEYAGISTDGIQIEGADKTSLIQVIAHLNPIVIIDESHNFRADLRVEMLRDINPCFILELTATPRDNSNIISFVDAIKLKRANMVKLPVIVYNHKKTSDVICSAIQLQKRLEKKAKDLQEHGGKYIRPIVLFQAQPNVDEESYNFEKIRESLIQCGIPKGQIKIKTAKIDEIKGINLMAEDCEVRYIITVNALKEGWDCPFAYILASLANKTSKVDVEQIVGRILRLPYTTQHGDPLLNISYVFTSSSDFSTTIKAVVESLNNAGFSKKDYRIGGNDIVEEAPEESNEEDINNLFFNESEEQETTKVTSPSDVTSSTEDKNNNEDNDVDDIDINPEEIRDIIDSDDDSKTNIDEIEATAESQSRDYNNQIDNTDPTPETPSNEVTQMANGYIIKEIFKEDADKVSLPYFVRYVENGSLFNSQGDYIELEKDGLEEGFADKLPTLDCNINYTITEIEGVKIDLEMVGKEEHRAQRFSLKDREKSIIQAAFESMPEESKKNNFVRNVAAQLKYDSIPKPKLEAYIKRSLESLTSEKVAELIDNQLVAVEAVKKKIDTLLLAHRIDLFKKLIDTGIIQIHSAISYHFPEPILFTKAQIGIAKGLYTEEQEVNGFEEKVINEVANLETVHYWHRNIDRVGFGIKGYIHHYPDFIVRMKSGKIVLIETKGDHLTNDDSKYKLELGKQWASLCGVNYQYFMVFESKPIDGAITYKELIERLSSM